MAALRVIKLSWTWAKAAKALMPVSAIWWGRQGEEVAKTSDSLYIDFCDM